MVARKTPVRVTYLHRRCLRPRFRPVLTKHRHRHLALTAKAWGAQGHPRSVFTSIDGFPTRHTADSPTRHVVLIQAHVANAPSLDPSDDPEDRPLPEPSPEADSDQGDLAPSDRGVGDEPAGPADDMEAVFDGPALNQPGELFWLDLTRGNRG